MRHSKFHTPLLWITIALFIFILDSGFPALSRETIRLATAGTEGNYYRIGQLLKKYVETADSNYILEVIPTEGSRDNVSWLFEKGTDEQVDFALMQGDVAYSESYFAIDMVGVAALYTEQLHIMARRELEWDSIEDVVFSGDSVRVGLGPSEGGTYANAWILLNHVLDSDKILSRSDDDFTASLDAIHRRELDILFYTIGSPSEIIAESLEKKETKLLDVDPGTVRDICKDYPFFLRAEIPYSDYEGCSKNLTTIGIKSLCVTRAGVDDKKVLAIYNALRKLSDDGESVVNFSADSIREGLTIALHPAIEKEIQKEIPLIQVIINKVIQYSIPFFLIIAVPVIIYFSPKILHVVHQYILARLFLFLVFTWVLGSSLMFLIEGDKNESFSTFGKSSIAILYYLFSGFEEKFPVTNLGNIVSIGIIGFGVALITLFTGTIVTVLIEHSLGIRHLRKKPSFLFSLRNHVVIAGWSERTKRIIKELRKPDITHKPSIIVVTDKVRDTHIRDRSKYRDVWVVEGDYTKPSALIRAELRTARTALMLSPDPENTDSDLRTVLTGTEIELIQPHVHTIAEALSIHTAQQMKNANIDEVVDIREYTSKFIAQSIISPGVMDFYNEVIRFGKNSQEFYTSEIPKELSELSFRQTQMYFLQNTEHTPVGYCIENDGQYAWSLNPRVQSQGSPGRDETSPGTCCDHGKLKLICLSDEQPDLKKIFKRSQSGNPADMKRTKINALPALFSEKGVLKMKKSYVGICHWNSKTEEIIRELQSSVLAKHHEYEITVLLNQNKTSQSDDVPKGIFKNVKYYYGDPTSHDVLESMGIQHMETFVILAQEGESVYTDFKTLIIAQTARRLNPNVHIVVEVLNSNNLEHFERADNFEIVSVNDITEKLMAQATITPGLTQIYGELLTATDDSNEVYIIPVPEPFVGKTFTEVAAAYISNPQEVILLGYRIMSQDGEKPIIVVNPRLRGPDKSKTRDYQLLKSDFLVVMAYEKP